MLWPGRTVTCANRERDPDDPVCRFDVHGTSTGVPVGELLIYVFVSPTNPPGGGWYNQHAVATVGADGTWTQTPSYIGNLTFPAQGR